MTVSGFCFGRTKNLYQAKLMISDYLRNIWSTLVCQLLLRVR